MHLLTVLQERKRLLGEMVAVAALGALFGYLAVSDVVLYVFSYGTDFTRLSDAQPLETLLQRGPSARTGLVAGVGVAALALPFMPGSELVERLARLRRILVALAVAAVLAVAMLYLSPHARIVLALFVGAVVALGAASAFRAAERGGSRWIDRTLSWTVFLGATGIFFLYSHVRHANFGSGAWDLGANNHSVWLASRFKPLISTILGDVHVIGDHFIPIVYVLAPVFWFTDSSSALLFVQAALTASTVFPLFWLARRNGLGRALSIAIPLAFLFARGTQSAVNFDFHETVIASGFLAYALYFLETGRARYAVPFLALILMCKEGMSLYLAFLGLYVAIFHRRLVLGGGLFVGGVAAFFIILKYVMPALLEGSHRGMIHLRFEQLGPSMEAAALRAVAEPLRTLAIAMSPAIKVETMALTFGTFAFICFFAPRFLVVALPMLAERFLTTHQPLWGLGFHYSVPLTLVAAVATVYGAARLRQPLASAWERLAGWRPSPPTVTGFLAALCLSMTILLTGWGAGPAEFATLRKPYFSRHVETNRRALRVIPADASVAAQNHFVPHLAMREKIWMLERPIRAEYVIANPDDGPWPYSRQHIISLLRELLARGYRPIFSEGMTIVLRKDGPTGVPLSPQIHAALR